ncbi:hypothetical protein KP509_01G040100 [Ceratopteris richardii]|uniref:Manganese-dependent ADP-ribose/CDP-alcohol diphosphatase n=1 Tax=Ceratopteris richardii TaxID=49495 RepID=A0A8T2VFJ6_CERRI|nr:hypothetical protein KP509_01G040100 [Ceratopteris richardii]KAH7446123.1 hypothetical protein KP509_01G040100 [Ceratopteris richardii]
MTESHPVVANGSCNKAIERPMFSFGVITDIQYADINDGCSFHGVPRFYRHSLEALQRAIHSWNKRGGLSFIIHLGDIVDGLCPKEKSYEAVTKVLDLFKDLEDLHVHHVLGNHCFYNLSRHELNHMLQIPGKDGTSYYTFTPVSGFRIVVLDGFDISMVGWPEGHPHHTKAILLLQTRNPNEDKNSPEGLSGLEERFVMFNGGVGEEQLSWFHQILENATIDKEKVIVCCHIPLHPDSTYPCALLWNYSDVLNVIHKFQCVKVCLAGHAHKGGYTRDSHGVHHRVLEAILECPPGTDAFGHIDVYEDCITLVGVDRMDSTVMYFD